MAIFFEAQRNPTSAACYGLLKGIQLICCLTATLLREGTRGFFQKFSRGAKVVKFGFSLSKNKKTFFCWIFLNPTLMCPTMR